MENSVLGASSQALDLTRGAIVTFNNQRRVNVNIDENLGPLQVLDSVLKQDFVSAVQSKDLNRAFFYGSPIIRDAGLEHAFQKSDVTGSANKSPLGSLHAPWGTVSAEYKTRHVKVRRYAIRWEITLDERAGMGMDQYQRLLQNIIFAMQNVMEVQIMKDIDEHMYYGDVQETTLSTNQDVAKYSTIIKASDEIEYIDATGVTDIGYPTYNEIISTLNKSIEGLYLMRQSTDEAESFIRFTSSTSNSATYKNHFEERLGEKYGGKSYYIDQFRSLGFEDFPAQPDNTAISYQLKVREVQPSVYERDNLIQTIWQAQGKNYRSGLLVESAMAPPSLTIERVGGYRSVTDSPIAVEMTHNVSPLRMQKGGAILKTTPVNFNLDSVISELMATSKGGSSYNNSKDMNVDGLQIHQETIVGNTGETASVQL